MRHGCSPRAQWRDGALGAACVAALVCGCKQTSSSPAPNQPPQTFLTSAPRDSSRTLHHVHFLWSGGDTDGTIAYYQYILDVHPRAAASIGQVVLHAPAVNDPRWHRVDAARLDLALPADTLRVDPRGDIGSGEFDRWSTFYLRAVDNEGAPDESPESRTLDAFTQAPRVWLRSPVVRGGQTELPRTFVLHWDGIDPIGDGSVQRPVESRTVLLPAQLDGTGQPIGFPERLYALTESEWGPWKAWAAPDSSGMRTVLRDLVSAGGLDLKTFVFAVQGRDDGGAITPKFDATTAQANNYAVLRVVSTLPAGPVLTVRDATGTLGPWTFSERTPPTVTVATTADTLWLLWDRPAASSYGGQGGNTRYGWDITDTSDDGQWTPWSNGRQAPAFPVTLATATFYLQGRDDIGQATTAVVVFQKTASKVIRPAAMPAPRTPARSESAAPRRGAAPDAALHPQR